MVDPLGWKKEAIDNDILDIIASAWMNTFNLDTTSIAYSGTRDRVYELNPAFFTARGTEVHPSAESTLRGASLMCALNSDVLTVHEIESIMYASSVLSECNTSNY